MRALLARGLSTTASLWPGVRVAYRWVHRAAHRLTEAEGLSGAAMRARYRGLLGAMARHAEAAGPLRGAIRHFLKVTRSYWPGLFACYDDAELPRTNNDLEQLFGSHRYHERRASGRKVASPGLVVRGAVRVVAAAATRLQVVGGDALAPADVAAWRTLRARLDQRRQVRTLGRRFRRDPVAYLHQLEDTLVKLTLPP